MPSGRRERRRPRAVAVALIAAACMTVVRGANATAAAPAAHSAAAAPAANAASAANAVPTAAVASAATAANTAPAAAAANPAAVATAANTAPALAAPAAPAAPPSTAAPAAGGAPPVMDEVVVNGERTGPGLWHVRRGAADLWILASLSPLPRGITWRSKQVEQLLDHTRRVLLQKPFDVGIARVLWLFLTEHSALMVGGGRRLKDVMPADLHERFARQRQKYIDDPDKWERFRPIVAAAFLQRAAFHEVGLSTRLDLGAAVRTLAAKRDIPIEELKVARVGDLMAALKSMTPGTENACVAASLVTVERDLPRLLERARAWAGGDVELIEKLRQPPEVDACRTALDGGTGAGELIALMRRAWLDAMDAQLQTAGTTLAVINLDLLLEPGGVLDELRAQGYAVEAP